MDDPTDLLAQYEPPEDIRVDINGLLGAMEQRERVVIGDETDGQAAGVKRILAAMPEIPGREICRYLLKMDAYVQEEASPLWFMMRVSGTSWFPTRMFLLGVEFGRELERRANG